MDDGLNEALHRGICLFEEQHGKQPDQLRVIKAIADEMEQIAKSTAPSSPLPRYVLVGEPKPKHVMTFCGIPVIVDDTLTYPYFKFECKPSWAEEYARERGDEYTVPSYVFQHVIEAAIRRCIEECDDVCNGMGNIASARHCADRIRALLGAR